MEKNVAAVHNCFGCGVCAVSCGRKIIEIGLNHDGFYEPYITDESKCTHCGICSDVCSYLHDDIALKDKVISSYGAWSKDNRIRRKCSSGGVGFEIAKALLNANFKICAVKYNAEKGRAEHYIAFDILGLIPSAGSKYIQSYTLDAFKAINRKEKYLVTGTPCQIDSFRRYIQKFHCEDNFILMDFFCHSVPSMFAWNYYTNLVEKKTGKITYVSWRNKLIGWCDSWAMETDGDIPEKKVDWHDSYNMLIKGDKSYLNSRMSQGDLFYKLFLGDYCCNSACHDKCRFKYDNSSADIRIGDAWGALYKDDEDGVSAVIAFTQKGENVLSKSNCTFHSHTFDTIAKGQMKGNSPKTPLRNWVLWILRNGYSLCLLKIIMLISNIIKKISKKYR